MQSIGKALLGALGAGVLAASLVPVSAQATQTPYNRVQRQQQRINQGVKNGSLTRAEYQRDQARLLRIKEARKADLAKNGGHLTAAEKANLQKRLNGNSRNIYFTKHNGADQKGK